MIGAAARRGPRCTVLQAERAAVRLPGPLSVRLVEKRGKLRLPVNGEAITVASAVHMSCPKCYDIVLRFRDARRLGEDAMAIYRRKHGLLSGDQIRQSGSGSS